MKISAQFMPGDLPVFVDSVRKAEDSGYARAYLVDGQFLWRNVFVYMTLGLDATERIPFGTAVTNPYTRHPSVLANAHATLEEIYPGRVILGNQSIQGTQPHLDLRPVGVTQPGRPAGNRFGSGWPGPSPRLAQIKQHVGARPVACAAIGSRCSVHDHRFSASGPRWTAA